MSKVPAIHDGRSRLVKRFWAKVRKDKGCWEWQGSKSAGYGQIPLKAHEFAYELLKGEIAEDLVVMHTCDKKTCVNPDHLVLGTTADNVHDSIRKGRWKNPPVMKGTLNPNSKVSESQVKGLRERYQALPVQKYVFVEKGTGKRLGSRDIGSKEGVDRYTVERILRNDRYREEG